MPAGGPGVEPRSTTWIPGAGSQPNLSQVLATLDKPWGPFLSPCEPRKGRHSLRSFELLLEDQAPSSAQRRAGSGLPCRPPPVSTPPADHSFTEHMHLQYNAFWLGFTWGEKCMHRSPNSRHFLQSRVQEKNEDIFQVQTKLCFEKHGCSDKADGASWLLH